MKRDPEQRPVLDEEMDRLMQAFSDQVTAEEQDRSDAFAARMRARLKAERVTRGDEAKASEPVRPRRRRMVWFAAAAAVLCIVAVAAFLTQDRGPVRQTYVRGSIDETHPAGALAAVLTGTQAAAVYELDERIKIYLNEATELVIEDRTSVELSAGEAVFVVEPNSGPFVVTTPLGEVRVTGTVFGILVDGEQCFVYLDQGTVEVSGAEADLVMAPGDRVRLPAAGSPESLPAAAGTSLIPKWAWDLVNEEGGADPQDFFRSVSHKQRGED